MSLLSSGPSRRKRAHRGSTLRKIDHSGKGRLFWEPGDPHPLDVMFEEARQVQVSVTTSLAALRQELEQLDHLPEAITDLSAEEAAAQQKIWRQFKDRKHYEHVQATFAALRRSQMRGRLQAAQAALALARDLLTAESPDLGQELAALLGELHTLKAPPPTYSLARGVGWSQPWRKRLAQFEAHVHDIKAGAVRSNGWFECHWIRKHKLKPEVAALRRRGLPLPADLAAQPTEERVYGPYLLYRWREGAGQIYAISLGRFDLAFEEAPAQFTAGSWDQPGSPSLPPLES